MSAPASPSEPIRPTLHSIADSIVTSCYNNKVTVLEFSNELLRKFPARQILRRVGTRAASPPIESSTARLPNLQDEPPRFPNLRHPSPPLEFSADEKWILLPQSEEAVLTSLMLKHVSTDGSNNLLVKYLQHIIAISLVSKQAFFNNAMKTIQSNDQIPPIHTISLVKLIIQTVANFRLSSYGTNMKRDLCTFLTVFCKVVSITADLPDLAPGLSELLKLDRFVSLLRVGCRRIPAFHHQIRSEVSKLDELPKYTESSYGPPPIRTAYGTDATLKHLVKRLLKGFQSDIPRFEHIAQRFGVPFSRKNASVEASLQAIVDVLERLLDGSITKYLKLFWSGSGEPFEKSTLRALVYSCNAFSTSSHHKLYEGLRESLSTVLDVLQASVSLVFERAMFGDADSTWAFRWGGCKRLEDVVHFLQFIRTEITCQLASLVLSMAIAVVCAFCMGAVSNMPASIDSKGATDAEVINSVCERSKLFANVFPELMKFARQCLTERVGRSGDVDRVPLWRSFGVWMFLFLSQLGDALRECRLNHVVLSRDLDRVLQMGKNFGVGTYGRYLDMPAELASKSVASSWEHVRFIRYLEYAIFCIIDAVDVQGRDVIIHIICKMDSSS